MSQELSNNDEGRTGAVEQPHRSNSKCFLLLLPVWVLLGFFGAQLTVEGIVFVLARSGVPFKAIDESVLSSLLASVIYTLTLIFVIALPWLIKKRQTTRQDVGMRRLPSWTDILLAPAGLVIYFLLSALLILGATHLLPGFDADQVQATGFSHLSQRYEYILAFITLVVIAPLAEETLFRGYLFGKLRKTAPLWVAVLITSTLFAVLHGAWNVGIDTFALSVVLCLLRESTGNIWASVLVHMMKNGIAFYILFINPMIFTTLGG